MATLEPKEWAAASQKWPVDIRNSKSKNGAAVKATDKKRASLYNLFLLFYDQTLKQFIFLFADSLSPKSCEEFSFGTFWRRRRFSFFPLPTDEFYSFRLESAGQAKEIGNLLFTPIASFEFSSITPYFLFLNQQRRFRYTHFTTLLKFLNSTASVVHTTVPNVEKVRQWSFPPGG